jgi:hypothetical protein
MQPRLPHPIRDGNPVFGARAYYASVPLADPLLVGDGGPEVEEFLPRCFELEAYPAGRGRVNLKLYECKSKMRL